MKLTLLSLALLGVNCFAACEQFYPPAEKLSIAGAKELCNSFYVSLYDEKSKAVLLTSELLVKSAKVGSMSRVESFRPDSRVKSPKLSDYRGSGYDRGHMVASDDASTGAEMYDTFLMTNMTPQEPTLNRKAWKVLEENIRKEFIKVPADTWVVTIAEYNKPKTIGSGVPVPAAYWKVVYKGDKRTLYYAENKPYAKVVSPDSVDFKILLKTVSK